MRILADCLRLSAKTVGFVACFRRAAEYANLAEYKERVRRYGFRTRQSRLSLELVRMSRTNVSIKKGAFDH